MVYDVAIIGGGLGGLVCANLLAKHGLGVVVLEKNPQMGGCLQTFERHGVKFDTGMHYIGSMDEGQVLRNIFNYLGISSDIAMSRLSPQGYDIVAIDGRTYPYANGYEQFEQVLSSYFPHQAAQVGLYVRQIREIVQSSPLYNLSMMGNPRFIESPYHGTTIGDFVGRISADRTLQAVLLGNMPLYAGRLDVSPAYLHAVISNSFIQSAFRLIGGSDSISHALCRSIERQGGQLRSNAEVVELICNSERVTALRLSSGEHIEAKRFISTIHPQVLVERIASPLLRRAYRERIAQTRNTMSNFTLYLRFKPNAVPYINSNLFYYRSLSAWAEPYTPERFGRRFIFMHQCHQPNPCYALSAELIAPMDYAEVAQWHSPQGRRSAAYAEFKLQRAQLLIDELNSIYPGISAHIDGYSVSTPLTYERYTATAQGATYGLMRDARAPERSYISHRTKIPNLLLAGQSITAHGALGVTVGAVLTCSEIIGLQLIDQLSKQC